MTDIQQCPEPRFKVGQVVVITLGNLQNIGRIAQVFWSEPSNSWFCDITDGAVWRENTLRPLSIDEIGSDELTGMAERLTAANERVLISQQVSDSMLAKLVDMERERDECRGNLAAFKEERTRLCGPLKTSELNPFSDEPRGEFFNRIMILRLQSVYPDRTFEQIMDMFLAAAIQGGE